MLLQVIVTNTVYETFLMFLLGYGLVQYPRHLWMQSNLDYYLLRTQMRASSDFKAIGESQLNISLVVADVMKTKAEVRHTCTHTRTYTHVLINASTPTHGDTHTHTQIQIHSHTHTCALRYRHTHTHTHTQARILQICSC